MGARTTAVVPGSAPAPVLAPIAAAMPRPPRLYVERPRLDAFLADVPITPLTVMVAPAGSGKTAAAASWNERHQCAGGVPVTWLPPNQGDLLARQIGVLRNRTDRRSPPVIVIDDAHLLAAPAADLLATVLAEDPETVRLLLIGRREPDFVPVSATLAGHVRSLRVEDLRFTADEATALVRAHHPEAAEDDIAAVLDQGEGWAAALVLGSRALRASGRIGDAQGSLAAARQPVLDYLLHEVVESLPPDLIQVLVTTCQEPHVTADAAVLLSAVPDAAVLLDQAADSGLLVTYYRDEHGPPGWRYHPLLLDLLRRRTAPTGPDWVRTVEAHHRATDAYVDRHDAGGAIRHARLTGDLDLQLRVLREFSAVLISDGRTSVVADVLASIPSDIRSGHQELLVLQATVLRAQHQVDAAKAASDRALTADARRLGQGVSRDVEAELAILDLWQARYGWREAAPALTRAQQVLGCRHDGKVSAHDITGIAPLRASWLSLELASFQTWLGDLELAAVHVHDAAMYSRQVDLPLLERAVLAHRSLLELMGGAYQSALTSAEGALAAGDGTMTADLAAARAYLVQGWARFQELRITDAEDCLTAFEETPRELLDPLLLVNGRLLRACVLTARGEVELARRVIDSRGDVPQLLPALLERVDRLVRLLVSVALGDLAGLEAETRVMQSGGMVAEASLGEAVVLGLSGEEHRAVRLLESLIPLTVDTPATIGLGAAVARVALLQRIGTVSSLGAARELVPDLLSRAAPQRLLWMLSLGALISPRFVDLIKAEAGSTTPHPFAAEAVAVLSSTPRPYADAVAHLVTGPYPGIPGLRAGDELARSMLTPRELEVLEQLALGGGNSDLARALFVSENTVKTHLASIYRKLEVYRRVDALRVARTRGLI